MAAHEPPVLVMVDTDTSMVFATVCKRNGADPNIMEKRMEDIQVLVRRQKVGAQTDRWGTDRSCSRATKRIQSRPSSASLQLGDQT